MAHPTDPATEADLLAYVEDQLPVTRRIEIEAHLCNHPEDAMRVMADLRIRDELRLALSSEQASERADVLSAARRLERGFARGRFFRQFRRGAVAAALVGVGWFAHTLVGLPGTGEVAASTLPPVYVGDAVSAHRTSLLRAVMRSQPESPEYDAAEIRSATKIVMPALPDDWSITDVQVFPSSLGPSVEVAIHTAEFGNASLYAVQLSSPGAIPPTSAAREDFAVAYWQHDSIAYVLVAHTASADVERAARLLSAATH
ncbi:anti-sigma factor family protein [Steroidobacter sp.]|uniref:anti-sigma factor family protein n=1 Tax=Steroidobacter sp. TaxID=1978227 RepID=UPI001A520690|nr:hypothetical protein [Steroidobacter sp.]MBL8271134.1 anti-sigma factor [Steroidobacter sp.]